MTTCTELRIGASQDKGLIDVYWLELKEEDLPADNDWLSQGEAAQLAAMRFIKRRTDWRLGRWTAKCAVAGYLNGRRGAPPFSNMEIRAAASGAPEVFIGGQPAPVNISITHRDGRGACAVARCGVALGCDLELVEPRSHGFSVDYFTASEQQMIARAPGSERACLVTLLWSAKESALKALDAGLRLDTRSVVVTLADEMWHSTAVRDTTWHSLQVVHEGNSVFHGWWQCTGGLVRTVVAFPPPSPPKIIQARETGFTLP
jgi:4'-phosphopantetheinyl transferase